MDRPLLRELVLVLLCLGALLASVAPLLAATASLSGRVLGPDGIAVTGAVVTLTCEDSGFARTTSSHHSGAFVLFGLQPGTYRLDTVAEGFASESRTGLTFASGQSVFHQVVLRLAQINENLQVTGEDPFLESSRTTLGTSVTTSQIDDLPIEGRTFGDFLGLTRLTPGVLIDVNPNRAISTAGQTGLDNAFQLDGLSFDDALNGVIRGTVSLDSIREITVLTNGYTAEHGKASGMVIDVVTRSGSNQLAGRMLLLLQGARLNATPATARLTDPPQEETDTGQSVLAGFLGGPLRRDRAFFFLSGELADRESEYINASPVVADFRPEDLLSLPVERRSVTTLARADLSVSQQDLLTARMRYAADDGYNGLREDLSAAERGRDIFDDVFDLAALYSRPLGRASLHELRGQFARRDLEYNVDRYCPGCRAENRPSLLLGKPANAPQSRRETQWQIVDTLSRAMAQGAGQHVFKAGFDLSVVEEDSDFPLDADGTFLFSTDLPFVASDSLTYPRRFTQNLGDPEILLQDRMVALFVQDEWSLRAGFSFNLGLRWDHESSAGISQDRNNLAPRLGIACSPGESGRTLLRAGYGVFFGQVHLAVARDAQIGFVRTVIDNPGYPDPAGPNPNPKPPGQATAPSTTRFSQDLTTPFTRQAYLGVQRRFEPRLELTVDFVRAQGADQLAGRDLNYPDLEDPLRSRPDPEFGQIIATESLGHSWYSGLQIGLRQQATRRIDYTLAYTLASAERDTEGFRFFPQDQRDYQADRGPANNDSRHLLVASGSVDLPARVRLTGLYRARSGLPYNVTTGFDDNRDSYFTDRPAGTGRNSERGASFHQLDIRLVKGFMLGRYEVSLLLESFNLLNRRNWLDYQGNRRSTSFGKPTNAAPARTIQLGLRVDLR